MKSQDVIALIQSVLSGDMVRFRSVAGIIAANEHKRSPQVAARIQRMIGQHPEARQLMRLPTGKDGEGNLVEPSTPRMALDEMVLTDDVRSALIRVIREHEFGDRLRDEGLVPACRLIFDGPPGTGKTSAAGALALALGVPLVVARQERIIQSYMGASSASLAKVFEFAGANRCVLLIDEFDSFGASRSEGNGGSEREGNRILNVLLQMMEAHEGPAVVIAATNRPEHLDHAIHRRFDVAVRFDLPSDKHRAELVSRSIGDDYPADQMPLNWSHAEIVRACTNERKRRIIEA
jgi:SpoVK/Ycf46/Vps4 family AAA+-type ATPase